MKFPLPRNLFPAVELPPDEAQALESYAASVVRETRDYYHDFLTTRQGQVDPSEWKKLKQQDSFTLYKQYGAAAVERRSVSRLRDPLRDNEVVPLMLAVGSLDGTVEDFKAHPFLVGTVMRVRDIVYLETTGFTTITGPDGAKQPLGYHLKHSIDLPDVHELTEFGIRSERVVDVFLRGFVCAMGDAPESLVVSTVTEIVMSIPKNLECAKMYKLAYLLKRATPPLKSSGSCKECSLCKRTVKPAAPGDIHKICCVCCARVCSSCRVVHKMLKVSPYKPGVTSEKMTFCVRCVRTASEISASLVAVHSVRDADAEALPEHDVLLWSIDVASSINSYSSSAKSESEVLSDKFVCLWHIGAMF
ncbi:hypothetical protein PHYSODRAFT_252993 [Phytophthora sojae]|uniref:FYVE-type domain-containing protein n=1 Tax=Phytophthora sojae (strain P6497) TaxID=1094619 RepID=G4ZQ30_PHYSP|nr:hypothetical protein PHYSODRAFT_252993 [Phytophthora sojae]EGZ14419.1 hypothetical protein PHYSODRAFT_252993 [Phytophthora sojae]|eukprot:XP_009528168.1 hypothetical protein PHYSODRAFT_252993 [Phytophthora sojae]